MGTAAQRRSDRVSLTLLLEASGKDINEEDFAQPARTMQINRTGAVILLDRDLRADQHILIKRLAPTEKHRQSQVRVVANSVARKTATCTAWKFCSPKMTSGPSNSRTSPNPRKPSRACCWNAPTATRAKSFTSTSSSYAVSKAPAESRAIARRAACPAFGRRRRTKAKRTRVTRRARPRRPSSRRNSARRRPARPRSPAHENQADSLHPPGQRRR